MPEAPVGAIKFMIQADSLNTSFEDAISDAIDDIDIDASDITDTIEDAISDANISGDDIDHIKNVVDEIRNDLLIRLRTSMHSENLPGARKAITAEILHAQGEGARKGVERALKTKSGQKLVPDDWTEEEMSEKITGRYGQWLSEKLATGEWKKQVSTIKQAKMEFGELSEGTIPSRIHKFINRIMEETAYEEEVKEMLETKYGIEALPQRTQAAIKKEAGREGVTDILDDTQSIIDKLTEIGKREADDEEKLKRAIERIYETSDELKPESLAGRIINQFWEEVGVSPEAKVIPRTMMKGFGEKEEYEKYFRTDLLWGRRFDIPWMLRKGEFEEDKPQRAFFEKYMPEKVEDIEEYLDEHDVMPFFGVLKNILKSYTMTERMEETGFSGKPEDILHMLPIAFAGKEGIIPESFPKDILTKKDLKELNQKQNKTLIEHLRTTVQQLKKLGFEKGKMEEVDDMLKGVIKKLENDI